MPLFRLQGQDVPFEWYHDCDVSFQLLKEKLSSAIPRFDPDFILATDASEKRLGAVLSQKYDGKEHASRVLHKAEKICSTTVKEALAFVWAVTHYCPYLYGRPFILFTDHCPLQCKVL